MTISKTCLDCGTPISPQADRCSSCAAVHRWGYGKEPACSDCGNPVSRHGRRCRPCATRQKWAHPEYRAKLKIAQENIRNDPNYRARLAKAQRQSWAKDKGNRREAVAERSRVMWQDTSWREHQAKRMRDHWSKLSYRQRVGTAVSKGKSRPDRVEIFRQRIKALWEDPEFREQHTGENHRAWKGGSEPWYGSYPEDFTQELRLSIRERDSFCCILCGEAENGKAHSVHHIDYDKINNDPANLVTLCRSCHAKTNNDRAGWQMAFETLQLHRDNS